MSAPELDIAACRRRRNYPLAIQARRVAWSLAWPLFRFSPRPLFGWRSWMLRRFGARVGRAARVDPSAIVEMPWNLELGDECAIGPRATIYDLGPIRVGARATVSHGAHLCAGTHDFRRADFPLLRPAIRIGDDAWIAADAFVGPGVSVGDGAVVGARAVVVRDVHPWTVVVGNPARAAGARAIHPVSDAPPLARSVPTLDAMPEETAR